MDWGVEARLAGPATDRRRQVITALTHLDSR